MLLEKLQYIINEFDGKCQELPHISRMNFDTIRYRFSEARRLLEHLSVLENDYTFEKGDDEVQYYKLYKPAFTSYCIYYERLLYLESNKPFGDESYYKECRDTLKANSKEIIKYISYYRIKETCNDQEYFNRSSNKKDIFAVIKAYEMLEKYIDFKDGRSIEEKINDTPLLKWTKSKADFAEMVNGFHLNKCFNDGNTTLEEINENLGRLWNVDVPDIHSATHDILQRKEPAKFSISLMDSIRNKKNLLLEKLFGR
jgi:hypothetical protein